MDLILTGGFDDNDYDNDCDDDYNHNNDYDDKKYIKYLNVPDTAMTLVLDTTDSSNTRKETITESCMEGDLFVFFILHGR